MYIESLHITSNNNIPKLNHKMLTKVNYCRVNKKSISDEIIRQSFEQSLTTKLYLIKYLKGKSIFKIIPSLKLVKTTRKMTHFEYISCT